MLDLVERAGLPRIRFHNLRHAAASLMLNHGVPVIIVSRRLGHSKVSITLDILWTLFPEMQNEAAELIDDLITPVDVEIPKNNVRKSLAVYG
jgi:integrase